MTTARLLFSFIFLISLVACEDNDDKSLATAQSCLNTATATTVDKCLTPITFQTTPAAFAIRCSADFIAQGFDTSRLTGAFADANNSSASTKPILTAVAYMAFKESLTAHTVELAVSNCAASNADSYRRLAEFARFATTMTANTTTAALDTTTAKSQINTKLLSGAENASVGAQTLVLYQDFCVEKSPFQDTSICTTFDTYKGYGDNATIGAGIMAYIAN